MYRFHVQKIVSGAVQSLHRRLRWQAIDEETEALLKAKALKTKYEPKIFDNRDSRKQLLARSRYFLFETSNKWTDTQKQRAKIFFKEYPELLESYNLSMYFRSCYENKRISFEQWVKKVETTSLKELKIAAETIKRNLGGIKNYFHNRAINAAVESFHSKLKLFRQRIGGMVDKEYFFLRTIQYFA